MGKRGGRRFYRDPKVTWKREWTNDQTEHVGPLGEGGKRWEDPLPPPYVSHQASRRSGYKTLERPWGVTPSFEFVLSDFCLLV